MSGVSRDDARRWAYEEFGHAELGHARRTTRLVRMATAAEVRQDPLPSGAAWMSSYP
ncbi:transposase DNA-binding-containing protein [Sorangium sp. So ce296]|uniref:transposase DNA-binding-containing protein n=1 Tax=Sorangium sp. So ce296 TaxID=3133296 RepID=UPI003F642686